MESEPEKEPIVRRLGDASPIACPHGDVRRIITGGEGGVANLHLVRVTEGGAHFHRAYDEVYYVLSGKGSLRMADRTHVLEPGTAAVIPAGVVHSLRADPGDVLEFLIFGVPGMPMDDERARPRRPE